METFFLEILSPERTFYSGECQSIMLPISDGMIGILAHHTPLTAALCDGEISFKTSEGEEIICAVTKGIADVTDNRVTLLCESALHPEEIDEERERRHLEEAKLQLKHRQSEKDYMLWQLSLNKAINRLKVKQRDKNINL